MKTINQKIIQFADYKGLSQYKFCKETGISDGALRGSKSVGVESLAKIKVKYPELNLDWLMFNEGPMLLGGDILKEPSSQYQRPVNIDQIVDYKIDVKMDALKEVLSELIRNDIMKEIDESIKKAELKTK